MQVNAKTKVHYDFAKLYQVKETKHTITCRCWDCNGRKGIPSIKEWHPCICCNGTGTITFNKSQLI